MIAALPLMASVLAVLSDEDEWDLQERFERAWIFKDSEILYEAMDMQDVASFIVRLKERVDASSTEAEREPLESALKFFFRELPVFTTLRAMGNEAIGVAIIRDGQRGLTANSFVYRDNLHVLDTKRGMIINSFDMDTFTERFLDKMLGTELMKSRVIPNLQKLDVGSEHLAIFEALRYGLTVMKTVDSWAIVKTLDGEDVRPEWVKS